MKNLTFWIESSKQAVRYWWLLLLVGIALFVIGMLTFVFPARSYVGMSMLFGWVILLTGILEVLLATANRHFITGRGWMLAGGIIEIVLGVILILNVGLSAATLPLFLGFWLMMRGFSTIGLGGDMRALGITGAGWTILTGILLVICRSHGRRRLGGRHAALCRSRRRIPRPATPQRPPLFRRGGATLTRRLFPKAVHPCRPTGRQG